MLVECFAGFLMFQHYHLFVFLPAKTGHTQMSSFGKISDAIQIMHLLMINQTGLGNSNPEHKSTRSQLI